MISNSNMKKIAISFITLIISMSILAGCIGGDNGNGDKPKLVQTGSSTVLPLASAWAEEFNDADISVSGGGSSHGLNALLKKEADLGDASRMMKGSDYEKVNGDPSLVMDDGTTSGAAPNGVWPQKWIVAFDVLAVVINPDNKWATELTYDQLYEIFTNDNPADYWDEVTGLIGAPQEKIEIYAPDEASGTYDYFFESIIPGWGKDAQQAKTRLEAGDGVYQPSADDNVILNAISDNKYAIGFFGFAYYIDNPGKVFPVKVSEDGSKFVTPSFETVADYPMARPLHIYTDGIPKEGSIINKYLRYVLGEEGQDIVPEVGYVRLSLVDSTLASTQLDKLQ